MEKGQVKKKKWFTVDEKLLLQELVRLNSSVINTGRRKGVSVQAKKKAWQNITDIYNDHPSTITPRTVIELRRCWDCMKFYAKKRGGSSVTDTCTGEEQAADPQTSSPSVLPAASPAVPLQHFPLHSQLLASILAKTDGENNAAEKVDSSSEASNGGNLRTDNAVDEGLPANAFDFKLNVEKTDLPASGAENQSETLDKTVPETLKHSSSDSSSTSTNRPAVTSTTASANSSAYDLIRDLQQENESLRQKVFTQELLLLEQIRQNARQEHEFRLKRDREEHEARMTALRQDAALRKIMFRVQLCQWQADT